MKSLVDHLWKICYDASDDRLNDFYIPALERSVRFDRTTGFFSSAALAIAAAGIARLIENGGHMRLLCGADLSKEDIDAIQKGEEIRGVVERALVGCLADPSDQTMRARLEALAWMIAHDRLEIRVVLPKGKDGLPLPAAEAREYYHPKEGVFEDADKNRLAFSGSSNDSENGWQWNYEVFSVYTTWPRGEGPDAVPALPQFVGGVERRFDRLWKGTEDGWTALPIPEAVRKKLLTYCPAVRPRKDPLEKPEKTQPDPQDLERERTVLRFLREAPFLPGARRLGFATAAITPWPHQLRVAKQVVDRFPQQFLFCDEVGLGKTIEVGLVLRQLVISGRVRRALLLVPKSVMRQWQEELYEKFVLDVPRYDEGDVRDAHDRVMDVPEADVWNACPLLIASSQLAKRRERQDAILAAEPWDLVVVDEAHHARRKDFLTDRYRPNRLLELLAGSGSRLGLKDRTRCLYLLTATPMQIDPVEVWDLLRVLGLGGRWGALQEDFLRFFSELRKPVNERDWDFLLAMLRDFLDAGGTLDDAFCEHAERELGLVDWDVLKGLPYSSRRRLQVAQLGSRAIPLLHEMVRRHTPLRSFMWRNTRKLLRKYRERGILKENVPNRDPRNQWITLRDGAGSERELYDRIEEYISHFYQKYEAERRGLGFVMTVYRQRLTSSFFALRKSLERRRDYLRGLAVPHGGMDNDDTEQDDLDLDVTEGLDDEDRKRFEGELKYVEDFLHQIRTLSTDSKLERLHEDLRFFFRDHETVLVFTRYTDTMDYLRDQLRLVYGRQVACYSGRGGERWDGVRWAQATKESVKDDFRKGDEIKILLCTESASEGLNLQTCGVLINYDMPWNPMRVEQRIGRIDRIGQRFPTVIIRNYFFEDTVEAIVYQRLGDRIGWFEDVVGELQPILHQVARVIENLAMTSGKDREAKLEAELARIRQQIDARAEQSIDLDACLDSDVTAEEQEGSPVTLAELEKLLVGSALLGPCFKPHKDIPGAYLLTWKDVQHAVTFRPEVYDVHPNSLALFSYGNRVFDEVLAESGAGGTDTPRGPGLFRIAEGLPVSMFAVPSGDGTTTIERVQQLDAHLENGVPGWTAVSLKAAEARLTEAAEAAITAQRRALELRRAGERLALVEEARRVLVRAALIEISMGANPTLFEVGLPHEFGSQAVQALKRHGAPFKGLLKVAGDEGLVALETDPYYSDIQGLPTDGLKTKWAAVRDSAYRILQQWSTAAMGDTGMEPRLSGGEAIVRMWFPTAAALSSVTGDREDHASSVIPFRVVRATSARPFLDCVPVYPDLRIAAGWFSEPQHVDEVVGDGSLQDSTAFTWIELPAPWKAKPGLFVARVVGESMNRRIPNGSWCLFRLRPDVIHGLVALVRARGHGDPDLGEYTIKVVEPEMVQEPDGTATCRRVVLRPDTTNDNYKPIVIEGQGLDDLSVVAEVVGIVGLPSAVRPGTEVLR